MKTVNIEKNSNESAASVLRRFTKKVNEAGILTKVRGNRYASRKLSTYKRKMATLELLRRRQETAKLLKLGKLKPNKR